ncbi:MAG: UDP-N-acetylmuramate--L-alanine ligase [Clostridia bacterium]|nr:UDP-N-acetylmuramate--L-alanine ligase [Clostridia bacterium]
MSTPNTHEGPARILSCLKACADCRGSVFFIGVGGVMMSSLALLTARAGHPVCGSDRARTAVTDALTEGGVTVLYGHAAENIPENCGLVVYTVAISEDNPEYVEALGRGIPCVSRADYLGALMTGYIHRVGVAGMHGKSTCTSMCAQILMDAAVDPTILSGAAYAPMGGAYRLGDSKEHFLFEACEYMDSFLDFHPTVAVLLGAELEHVDYFKDMEQITESFARYASLTGPKGVTVVNLDDDSIPESARRALERGLTGRLVTFSAKGDPAADFRAEEVRMEEGLPCFTLIARGETRGEVRMAVPGRHQVINALAAAAAMDACGIPMEAILSGLSHYVGAGRRMEYKGDVNGARVYDDYGHHPTEVRATLEGAKALCREGCRLICVFQPHTYSRTAALYADFLTAFDAADRVLFMDIYAAREDNIYGVSSAGLAADINQARPDKAVYCATPHEAAEAVRSLAKEGDTVVIMGAGDVIKVTARLFEH